MGENKHTPGPWEFVSSDEYGYSTLWNPDTRQEVIVTGGKNDGDAPITWMGEEMSDADRLLIEAATELLKAAKAARAYMFGSFGNGHPLLAQLDAVIAKSEARND